MQVYGNGQKISNFFSPLRVNFLDFSLKEIDSTESPFWPEMHLLLASGSFFVPLISKKSLKN